MGFNTKYVCWRETLVTSQVEIKPLLPLVGAGVTPSLLQPLDCSKSETRVEIWSAQSMHVIQSVQKG